MSAASKFGQSVGNNNNSTASKFGGTNNNNNSATSNAASKFGAPSTSSGVKAPSEILKSNNSGSSSSAAAAPSAPASSPADATSKPAENNKSLVAPASATAPNKSVAAPVVAAAPAPTPQPQPASVVAQPVAAPATTAIVNPPAPASGASMPTPAAAVPEPEATGQSQPQQQQLPHDEQQQPSLCSGSPPQHDDAEEHQPQLPVEPLVEEEPEDPDVNLQPAVKRLMAIVEPLSPTFISMLAGDFHVPWPKNATQCPPFDPLSQRSVKRALKEDNITALHSLCITRNKTIVVIGANGMIDKTVPTSEMRKISLVKATRDDPSVLIVDLVDAQRGPEYRATAFYVLLTGYASNDRAEMCVKNSLSGVPYEVLSKPPEVRMPSLDPLLRRMSARLEEHDALMKERAELLERIRQLQYANASRDAVAKLTVDAADAPAQEHERQSMLNVLVHYVCSAKSRANGDFA